MQNNFLKELAFYFTISFIVIIGVSFAGAQDPTHLLNQIEQVDCTAPSIGGPNHYLQTIGGPSGYSCKEVKTVVTECSGEYSYFRGNNPDPTNPYPPCGDVRVDGEMQNKPHHDHYGVIAGGGLQMVPDSRPNVRGILGLTACPFEYVLEFDGANWNCHLHTPWSGGTNSATNAGIGTNIPSTTLEVFNGGTKAKNFFALNSADKKIKATLESVNQGGILKLYEIGGAVVPGVSSNPYNIDFSDAPNAVIKGFESNGFQAAFLAGRVGIGVEYPSELLEVNKSQALGGVTPLRFTGMSINNPDPLGGTTLKLKEGADTRAFASYNNSANLFNIGAVEAGAPMVFYTQGSERMRITPDGKVGIGTAIPLQELHIYDETDPAIVLETSPLSKWVIGMDAGEQDRLIIGRGETPVNIFPTVRLSSSPSTELALGNTDESAEVFLTLLPTKGGMIALKKDGVTGAVIRGYSDNGTQAYFARGNIGIGVQNALQELHIYDPNGEPGIVFERANTNFDTYNKWYIGTDGFLGQLKFGTGTNLDSTIMSLNEDGYVSIGSVPHGAGKLNIHNDNTPFDRHAIYVKNDDPSTYALSIIGTSNRGIYLDSNPSANCYDQHKKKLNNVTPLTIPTFFTVDDIIGRGPCSLNDYAEMMEFSQEPKDGQLIIIDTDNPGLLKVSAKPYDPLIAGVASENPAMVIGSYGISIKGWEKTKQDGYYTYPLAIAGRKIIQTTSENGKIVAGDLLVTSSQPGKAMKCALSEIKETDDFETVKQKTIQNKVCNSAVFAKALTGANEGGEVLALITLQ